jgi:hypothetical protein
MVKRVFGGPLNVHQRVKPLEGFGVGETGGRCWVGVRVSHFKTSWKVTLMSRSLMSKSWFTTGVMSLNAAI